MNAQWIQKNRSMVVGLLGAAVVFASPIAAQADQGKWWNPGQGGKHSNRGGQRSDPRGQAYRPSPQGQAYRPNPRGQAYRPNPQGQAYRPNPQGQAYRPPAWRGQGSYGQGQRFSRGWSGRRVYRERASIRLGSGYRGRPVYGWRYYSAPTYFYPRQTCYVSPLRFFISADAVIGGVYVHGTYSDPCPIYGCNFCDAEFTSYDEYAAHVAHCPYAPHGYRVVASDWDHGQWNGDGWQDDQNWQRDDNE